MLAPAFALAGCATVFVTSQASDHAAMWDEQVHEVTVPKPGVDEALEVALPLDVDYEPAPPAPTMTAQPGTPPPHGPARPFALVCRGTQHGTATRYHAAFRYGSTWKKEAGIAFLVESALASVLLLTADAKHQDQYVYGGLLAIDAAVTGAIFFIPRKEIYSETDYRETTALRDDCPDGLELVIGDEAYPVDAAGRIGEVGAAALGEWMASPRGDVRARFAGRDAELVLGDAERCRWARARAPIERMPSCGAVGAYGVVSPADARATLAVPVGTLGKI